MQAPTGLDTSPPIDLRLGTNESCLYAPPRISDLQRVSARCICSQDSSVSSRSKAFLRSSNSLCNCCSVSHYSGAREQHGWPPSTIATNRNFIWNCGRHNQSVQLPLIFLGNNCEAQLIGVGRVCNSNNFRAPLKVPHKTDTITTSDIRTVLSRSTLIIQYMKILACGPV